MQLGMIGLGRMGSNLVRRLHAGGHDAVVYDVNPTAVAGLEREGFTGVGSIADLVDALAAPRAVWVMVPAAHAGAAACPRSAPRSPRTRRNGADWPAASPTRAS